MDWLESGNAMGGRQFILSGFHHSPRDIWYHNQYIDNIISYMCMDRYILVYICIHFTNKLRIKDYTIARFQDCKIE